MRTRAMRTLVGIISVGALAVAGCSDDGRVGAFEMGPPNLSAEQAHDLLGSLPFVAGSVVPVASWEHATVITYERPDGRTCTLWIVGQMSWPASCPPDQEAYDDVISSAGASEGDEINEMFLRVAPEVARVVVSVSDDHQFEVIPHGGWGYLEWPSSLGGAWRASAFADDGALLGTDNDGVKSVADQEE